MALKPEDEGALVAAGAMYALMDTEVLELLCEKLSIKYDDVIPFLDRLKDKNPEAYDAAREAGAELYGEAELEEDGSPFWDGQRVTATIPVRCKGIVISPGTPGTVTGWSYMDATSNWVVSASIKFDGCDDSIVVEREYVKSIEEDDGDF